MPLELRKPSPVSPAAIAAFVEGGEPDLSAAVPLLRTVADRPTLERNAPKQPAPKTAASKQPVVTTAHPPSAAPSFRRPSRAIVQRRTRPDRRRTTVYLDVPVASELAQVLTTNDQELSDAVNEAVRTWLDARK